MYRSSVLQNSQADLIELSVVDGGKCVFKLDATKNDVESYEERMEAMEKNQKSSENRLDRMEDSLVKMSEMLEKVVNNQQPTFQLESDAGPLSNNQAFYILSEQIKLGQQRQEALMLSLLDKDRQVVTQLTRTLEILQSNSYSQHKQKSSHPKSNSGPPEDDSNQNPCPDVGTDETGKNDFIQISNEEIKDLKVTCVGCVTFIGQLLMKSFPPKYFENHTFAHITHHQLKKLFEITRGQFKVIKRRNNTPPHELLLPEFKEVVTNKIRYIRHRSRTR